MSEPRRDATSRRPFRAAVEIAAAERAVVRAAAGCIDKKGYAFRLATESMARTFFINEHAYQRLERAVARLKEVRLKARNAKRRKS